jgi:hypothetical protein
MWLLQLAAAVLRGRRYEPIQGAPYEPGGQSREMRNNPVNFLPNAPQENPYVARAVDVTNVLVGDLQPVAPKDVIDPSASEAIVGHLARSDVVDPYSGAGAFPDDAAPSDGLGFAERRRRVALGSRVHIARMDKLPAGATGEGIWGYGPEALVPTQWGGTYQGFIPESQYPLASHEPLNSMPQAAREDVVSPTFRRFFAQAHDNEMKRQEEVAAEAEMQRTDQDGSSDIQSAEFMAEMEAQNKTQADAQAMFDANKSPGGVVNKQKYKELSKTGYAPPHAATFNMKIEVEDAGTWGSRFYCGAEPPAPDATGPPTPELGVFITGMRLKRMVAPSDPGVDATSINAVEFRCMNAAQNPPVPPTVGPATITSAEGEQGTWTQWHDCPAGSAIDAVHVRTLPYDRNVDNLGITDLVFDCRKLQTDAEGLHEPTGNLTTGCFNVDNGKKDTDGATCADYTQAHQCGAADDDDFSASSLCCLCGGGDNTDPAIPVDQRDLGGWEQPKRCTLDPDGNQQFLCAVQTRVLAGRVESTRDNMGLTQLDLQCCSSLSH